MAVAEAAARFGGVIVPLATPFTEGGEIAEPIVARLVNHVIAGGANALFPLGTTGEAASIHPKDRHRLVAATIAAANGRVPIFAGVSGNCLRESAEAATAYAAMGAAAVVAHPPYYFPVAPDDLRAYFARLADASPVPLLLYNIPKTTHIRLTPDTVVSLAVHGNIAGIKESDSDAEAIRSVIRAVRSGGYGPERFAILLGVTALYAPLLREKVDGLVPGTANLEPELYAGMWRAASAARWDEVDALQIESDRHGDVYQAGRPLGASLAALKRELARRGICTPYVLPPLRQFSSEIEEEAK